MRYQKTFVTDLNLPEFKRGFQKIIDELSSFDEIYSRFDIQPLSNGKSRIEIEFRDKQNDKDLQLTKWIAGINLSPITASISTEFALTVDILVSLENIFGVLVNKYYNLAIDSVNTWIQKVDNLYFTHFEARPLNKSESIYYDPRSRMNFSGHFNLKSAIGYRFLGNNPLFEFIRYDQKLSSIEIFDQLALVQYPIGKLTDITKMVDLQQQIDISLSGLANDGYFYYPNVRDSELIQELSEFWPIKIIRVLDHGLVLWSQGDFFVKPETWLEDAIESVRAGSLPKYRFSGRWTSFQDSATEIYGDIMAPARCFFGIMLAYSDLIQQNPELEKFIPDITVHQDLSITFNLSSWKQAQLLTQSYFHHMETINGCLLKICKDSWECIQLRFYLAFKYPQLTTMAYSTWDGQTILMAATKFASEISFGNWSSEFNEKIWPRLLSHYQKDTTTIPNLENLIYLPSNGPNVHFRSKRWNQLLGYYSTYFLPGLVKQMTLLTTDLLFQKTKDPVNFNLYQISLDEKAYITITTSNIENAMQTLNQQLQDGKLFNPWAWYLYQNTGGISVNLRDMFNQQLKDYSIFSY